MHTVERVYSQIYFEILDQCFKNIVYTHTVRSRSLIQTPEPKVDLKIYLQIDRCAMHTVQCTLCVCIKEHNEINSQ